MSKSIPNDIFQFSLHSAYQSGLRDGGPPVAFLMNHGNHGIGVFENETDDDDEEEDNDKAASRPNDDLIQIDGVAYTIDPSGSVSLADKEAQLPFVMVTIFQPTQRSTPPVSTTCKKLRDLFDASGRNTPMPFRVKGAFKYINTQQRTFWDVRGTMFGYSVPGWQKAISGEGLQCCFLSEDRKLGGRVIDFETGSEALLEWAKCGRFHLGFPQDEDFEELRL